jgi:hypothetical protein
MLQAGPSVYRVVNIAINAPGKNKGSYKLCRKVNTALLYMQYMFKAGISSV